MDPHGIFPNSASGFPPFFDCQTRLPEAPKNCQKSRWSNRTCSLFTPGSIWVMVNQFLDVGFMQQLLSLPRSGARLARGEDGLPLADDWANGILAAGSAAGEWNLKIHPLIEEQLGMKIDAFVCPEQLQHWLSLHAAQLVRLTLWCRDRQGYLWCSHMRVMLLQLVGGLEHEFYFSIYWE